MTWQQMITYVDDRARTLSESMLRCVNALNAHEQWHRDNLAQSAAGRRASTATWALVVAAALSCVGSLILDIVTLAGR